MKETRERILLVAMQLFSSAGYAAVSMRDIARCCGITQGAIYRHYAGKLALFESIIKRMIENDRKLAVAYQLPEEPYPSGGKVSLQQISSFTLAMFQYWTEDPFASLFRKMLTIEQYRNRQMSQLYQNYLGAGVLQYLEGLFRECGFSDATQAALEYFAPFHLLLNQYDHSNNPKKCMDMLNIHLENFKNNN